MISTDPIVQKKLIAATQDIIAADGPSDELKAAGQAWIDSVNDAEASKTAAAAYVAELEKCGCDASKAILADKVQIAKAVNATPISLEDAPRGYAEFDQGAARKYVLNPNGYIKAA